MTREEIEQTDWAKQFKADSPLSYERAIEYALQDGLEVIIKENDETGDYVWAIIVFDNDYYGFWMDAKETKREVLDLCKSMGWFVLED